MAQKRRLSFSDGVDESFGLVKSPRQVSKDFIIGRAIVTANTSISCISKKKDESEFGDLHLSFQYFEINKIPPDKFEKFFKTRLSGVMFLELFYRNMMYETKVSFGGLLGFTCDQKLRDEYLEAGVIPHNKLASLASQDGLADVLLADANRLLLITQLTRSSKLEIIPISTYIDYLPFCINSRTNFNNGDVNLLQAAQQSNQFQLSSWLLPSFLDEWISTHNLACAAAFEGERDNGVNKGNMINERPLQIHEFIYIYTLIDLRFPVSKSLDIYSYKICIRAIKLTAPKTARDSELAEFYSGTNINNNMLKILNRFARKNPEIIETAVSQYLINRNKIMVALSEGYKLSEVLEEKKRCYYSYPLSTSIILNKLRVGNILTAPTTLLDPEVVKSWVDRRIDVVKKTLNDDVIYHSVYNQVVQVIAKNIPLKLYNKTGLYALDYIDKYNSGDFLDKPLEPPGQISPAFKHYKMPYDDESICQTGMDRGCMYAAVHGAPIWQRQTVKGNCFISARQVNSQSQDDNLKTPYQIFKSMLWFNGFNHEIQNSGYHISTLILDIDLCPAQLTPNMDLDKLAKDCVNLAELLLERIEVLRGKCTHYIFYSTPNQVLFTGRKFGIHHHIRLPDGVVMSFQTAAMFNDIMGQIRYLFKDTIGVFCGEKDGDVYDPKIYKLHTKNNDALKLFPEDDDDRLCGKIHHRPMRLPGQCKKDKSNRLECIYRTDGKALKEEIPITSQLTHGPMEADFGILIKKLEGCKPIRDNEYMRRMEDVVINRYVNENCKFSGQNVMRVINSKTLLFFPTLVADGEEEQDVYSENQLVALATMMNEIWDVRGRQRMKLHLMRLKSTASNHVYSAYEIDNAVKNSQIIYGTIVDKFLLTSNIYQQNFNICPTKVHGIPHVDGVEIQLYTESNMNRFGFYIASQANFKRCQNSYVKDVSYGMSFVHPCLFDSVKRSVENELLFYNNINTTFLTMTKILVDDITGAEFSEEIDMNEVIDYKTMDFEFSPIEVEDPDNPIADWMNGSGGVGYLYAHYKNKNGDMVTALRSNYNFFLLLCKTDKGERKPFVTNHPLIFIDAMRDKIYENVIEHHAVETIKTIMEKLEGHSFLSLNQDYEMKD